jgi:hypothetical protein
VLVFDARALVRDEDRARERDARLVLADGRVTVTPNDDDSRPLHSVPYDSVLSISYSFGRDPLWNSPRGPVAVTRTDGPLRKFGFSVAKHWIAIRTNAKDRLIVVRVNEPSVPKILSALEERTGRTPELVTPRKRAG